MNVKFFGYALWLFMLTYPFSMRAQLSDSILLPNVYTTQLFMTGNQLGYPILRLGSKDQMQLNFDDLDADVKSYSYTFQLCNADWTPADLSGFDFIKGFSQINISEYRLSSIALTRYTHYVAMLPDLNCIPSRSGNYILKVFLNGDTSQLAFTKRFLVIDNKVNIGIQMQAPFDAALSQTHQKLLINVTTRALNVSYPERQIHICVLQNERWDMAIRDIQPTFYAGNVLQYTRDEDFIFPGGRQWRWIDLQHFTYQSERIQGAQYNKSSTEFFAKIDPCRASQPYYFYKDYNGFYFIQTTESINPYYQGDYARVHFSYMPPEKTAYPDKDVYIIGQLTGYKYNDSTRMVFNPDKGVYETSLFLKQGYYNYCYATIDRNDPQHKPSFDLTEGNFIETENDYYVLIYYRDLGDRADQLVGYVKFNSLMGK